MASDLNSPTEAESFSPNRRKQAIWCLGAFVVCFFVGGGMWWLGSYREFLDASFHWQTIPLLAGAALLLTGIAGVRVLTSAVVVGSSFPAIMMTRVVLDCIQSPTAHNLWPFEVGAACVFGLIMAGPAAWVGGVIWLIRHRRNAARYETPSS